MMLAQGDRWGLGGLGALLISTALATGCGDNGMETASDGSTSGQPTTSESTGGSMGTTTTPTTSTTGTTGDETTGTPTTTMTVKEDMGGIGAMCNPSEQDCPDGQKCIAYESMPADDMPGWDANQCVQEPLNAGKVGDPCDIADGESVFSGLDNCSEGSFCFNFDFMTGKGGTCTEFCKPDESCPETNGGNSGCVQGANGGVLPICLPKCDPLLQDCPDGQGCYGDVSLPFFICAGPDTGMGTGTDNEPCEFTNACAPGFSCTAAEAVEGCDPMSVGCCSPFCSVMGGDGDCAPSEDCVPFYEMNPPPGAEDVGVCAIPQ